MANKQVPDDVRRIIKQIHELELRVLDGNADPKALRQPLQDLLDGRVPVPSQAPLGIFTLTVDYSRTLADLVVAGGYDYAKPDITDRNFPQEREGIQEIEMALVHLNRIASTREVEAELDHRGLRFADMHELVHFGIAYPELQRQFEIYALGSDWFDPSFGYMVGYLYGNLNERWLRLSEDGPTFRRTVYSRYLAVRKTRPSVSESSGS